MFILRSDPGPKLLQPIDTFEDVQDDLDGKNVKTTNPTTAGEEFENKIIKKRKRKLSESGVIAAGKGQEIVNSSIIKIRGGRFTAPNVADFDVADYSRTEPDDQIGFKAPPGMTFQPMCSACDESTDSE
jgi:hypothetical protein